jgi:pectate lyase
MLERLGFSEAAATYLTGTCGIDSLDEITYLDDIDDLDTTIKGVTNTGGTVTTVSGTTAVNNGIPVSIREVANLKFCVYYLKHM